MSTSYMEMTKKIYFQSVTFVSCQLHVYFPFGNCPLFFSPNKNAICTCIWNVWRTSCNSSTPPTLQLKFLQHLLNNIDQGSHHVQMNCVYYEYQQKFTNYFTNHFTNPNFQNRYCGQMTSFNFSCRKLIDLRHCVLNVPRSANHLYRWSNSNIITS